MIAYRPAPHARALIPYSAAGRPSLGQTDVAAVIPLATVGLVGLAFVGATGWVGIRTGLKEKGLMSAVGWITGIGGILLGGLFFSIPVAAMAQSMKAGK